MGHQNGASLEQIPGIGCPQGLTAIVICHTGPEARKDDQGRGEIEAGAERVHP
jgi:hypothetical protein